MQSFEIEQKYRCRSLAALRAKLRRLKARFVKKGSEVNEFWDLDGMLATKKTVLRLRRHGKTAELTLKGPRLKSKYTKRVELQTPVDFLPTQAILKSLGFSLSRKYSKKREVYYLGRVLVVLDSLPKIGNFIELEGSVRDIERAEMQLGLKREDREERSYHQMLFSLKG